MCVVGVGGPGGEERARLVRPSPPDADGVHRAAFDAEHGEQLGEVRGHVEDARGVDRVEAAGHAEVAEGVLRASCHAECDELPEPCGGATRARV